MSNSTDYFFIFVYKSDSKEILGLTIRILGHASVSLQVLEVIAISSIIFIIIRII